MGLFYFIHDTRVQGIKMNAILINIKAKTKVIRLGPKASIAVHGSALGCYNNDFSTSNCKRRIDKFAGKCWMMDESSE